MNGIIPFYKPLGPTSASCVYQLRKILHERKIGHTGTLDPEVDGVLVICVGQATKLVNHLMQSPKTYRGQITLGIATTTEDATGEVIKKQLLENPLPLMQIDRAFKQLTGKIEQTPPLFSAVRVNGKHLYEYARSHQDVQRPSRLVEIYYFERKKAPRFDKDRGVQIIDFEVSCSKGTYIRTLAVQLGEILGVPAHMNQLTRIHSGGFDLEQTFTLEQIENLNNQGHTDFMFPLIQAFPNVTRYPLTSRQWEYVKNGRILKLSNTDEQLALFHQGVLKAIYLRQENSYVPYLMLLKNDR